MLRTLMEPLDDELLVGLLDELLTGLRGAGASGMQSARMRRMVSHGRTPQYCRGPRCDHSFCRLANGRPHCSQVMRVIY